MLITTLLRKQSDKNLRALSMWIAEELDRRDKAFLERTLQDISVEELTKAEAYNRIMNTGK